MKKTSTSLLLSLILALSLLLSGLLVSCSEKKEMTDAERIVGTWTTEFDLIPQLIDLLGDEADYFPFTDASVTYTFGFSENGAYYSQIDADSYGPAAESLLAAAREGCRTILEETLPQLGYASVDDMLRDTEQTMDDIAKSFLIQYGLGFLLDEEAPERDVTMGNYILSDGKLSLTTDPSTFPDPAYYSICTFEGNDRFVVTLPEDANTDTAEADGTGTDTDGETEATAYGYPIVYTRKH